MAPVCASAKTSAHDAEGKADHQCGALADAFCDRSDNCTLHDDRSDADAGERQADDALVPAVAVQHV
jgi:hypothetical protein